MTSDDLIEMALCPLPVDRRIEIERQGILAFSMGLAPCHCPYLPNASLIGPEDREDHPVRPADAWFYGWFSANEDARAIRRARR